MLLSTIAILAMSTDVSQLAAELGHPDPIQRSCAAELLSSLGPDAQPAAVALVRACDDPTEEVREWAAIALDKMGRPSLADLEALASLVAEADDNPHVGHWAATLLGRLREDAAPAVTVLASAVSGHSAMPVRERAAWALGKIGPPAAPSLKTLRQATCNPDRRLARIAQRAIAQIGG